MYIMVLQIGVTLYSSCSNMFAPISNNAVVIKVDSLLSAA